MPHTKTRIASLAIIATFAAASHQDQAQDAFVALDVSVRPVAAEEMEQRAKDIIMGGRGWDRAAGLYRRAAELRGTDDIRSADNLRLAGYIQYYRGRPLAAVLALTQPGRRSSRWGTSKARQRPSSTVPGSPRSRGCRPRRWTSRSARDG